MVHMDMNLGVMVILEAIMEDDMDGVVHHGDMVVYRDGTGDILMEIYILVHHMDIIHYGLTIGMVENMTRVVNMLTLSVLEIVIVMIID